MNDDLKLYLKFTKKDEDQRVVGGYASTEDLDSQGEVVEKDAIEAALPAYLGDIDETGKFRYGNIREMHQMSAVGKTMKAKVDSKGLYVEAKVIDNNAWQKVKEGVYAGFSIGGRVMKQVENRIKALRLSEISLVDRPANPAAVFNMVKIDNKGKVTDMQKQEDHPETAEYKETPFREVMEAKYILELASELRMVLSVFEAEGRSTQELMKALTALKELAVKILTTEEDKKKFETILYGLDTQDSTKFTLDEAIKKQSQPKVIVDKKAENIKDIVKHINTTWQPGYFKQMKKVLG